MLAGVLDTPPPVGRTPPPLHTTMFPCIALVMPFSRDTFTELNMTIVRLSGAKSLWDPSVYQLLGEWVASSPLARARWSEAMVIGYRSLIRTKQVEAVKQYASHLFPAPDLIGLLMDLNVLKLRFWHVSEYMSRRGPAYTAATGLPFPRPIPTRDTFTDTWKELVTPLDLRPPVSVPDPPAAHTHTHTHTHTYTHTHTHTQTMRSAPPPHTQPLPHTWVLAPSSLLPLPLRLRFERVFPFFPQVIFSEEAIENC